MPKFTVTNHYRDSETGARHMKGESVTLSNAEKIERLQARGFIGQPEGDVAEQATAPAPETADAPKPKRRRKRGSK